MFRKSAAICVTALLVAAFDAPQRNTGGRDAFEAAMGKADACAEARTHACMFDLFLEAADRLPSFDSEVAGTLVEVTVMTREEALIDDVIRRAKWNNPAGVTGYRIRAAVKYKDRDTLAHHADRAISGVNYTWYDISNLARGLAETGDISRARRVADLIPHTSRDSITARNLHRDNLEVIAFNDPATSSFRDWARGWGNSREWWDSSDDAWFEQLQAGLAGQPARLEETASTIQARYRENGWQYLRALARMAEYMSGVDDAATAALFRGYVESWADPRNDSVAEGVIAIAANAGPQTRAAVLAAFDARQPSPPESVARMRRAANTPDEGLDWETAVHFGMAKGSFSQKRAAEALVTLSKEELIAQAKAGEGFFDLSGFNVLRDVMAQTTDRTLQRDIAVAMADIGETKGADYSRGAARWALEHCDTALYDRVREKAGASYRAEAAVWDARISGDPLPISMWAALYDERSGFELRTGVDAYEMIILHGYCPTP